MYQILDRRARTRAGEIDLIAKKGDAIIFVEVKASTSDLAAIEMLGQRQKNRILRAAEAWMQQHARYQGAPMRFDLIAIDGWRVRHHQDAWRSEI